MFFILLMIWLIFVGEISIKTAALGAVVCGLITLFCSRFMDYRTKGFYASLKKTGRFLHCIAVLIKEIFIANMGVLRFVYGKKEPEPMLVHFKGGFESVKPRVLAANSITLTPGTITVRLEGDEFYVHALDRSFADGIENCSLVKNARELEV